MTAGQLRIEGLTSGLRPTLLGSRAVSDSIAVQDGDDLPEGWFLAVMPHRFLSDPADPAFRDVLRMYHTAFERASREPDERLFAELRGAYRLPFRILVAEDGRGAVAFARFCRLPASGMGFLIHIAVDEDARGGGVGSMLLRAVATELAPGPLLVEIEHFGRVHDWYVRHGFHPVTKTYTQPALHSDTEPVPFALYASQPVADPIGCIRAFYAEVWELAPDHPFVVEACRGARPSFE